MASETSIGETSVTMNSPSTPKMDRSSAADVYRRINQWCIRGIAPSGEVEKITGNPVVSDEDTSGSEEETSEDDDEEEGKEEMDAAKAVKTLSTPFDCLAPKGKDLEHRLCSKDTKLWTPAISHQGLLQLEHFLYSFQAKQDLSWLEAIYYPTNADKIRADRVAYLPILKEATQLLLSTEESLVACFIGFLHRLSYFFNSPDTFCKTKINGLVNYAHKSIDFPNYTFFVDVIAYAHRRLPHEIMERIARAIVATLDSTSELHDATNQVEINLVPDVNEFPEPLNPLSIVNLTPEQLSEKKICKAQLEVLSAWLIDVMEDEAKEIGLEIREPEDDEEWWED